MTIVDINQCLKLKYTDLKYFLKSIFIEYYRKY